MTNSKALTNIWLNLRTGFSINEMSATKTALAMMLATFFAILLHFEGPYWAVITVVTIMNPYVGTTVEKGMLRIVGTLVGAALGTILANIISDNLVVLLTVTFLVTFIGHALSQRSQYQYAYILMTLTCLLVYCSIVVSPDYPFRMAVWRSLEIILGVLVSLVVTFLFYQRHIDSRIDRNCLRLILLIKQAISRSYNPLTTEKRNNRFRAVRLKLVNLFNLARKDPSYTANVFIQRKSLFEALRNIHRLIWLNEAILARVNQFGWLPKLKLYPQALTSALREDMNILRDFTKLQNFNQLGYTEKALQRFTQQFDAMRDSKKLFNYPLTDIVLIHDIIMFYQRIVKIFTELKQGQASEKPEASKVVSKSVFKPDYRLSAMLGLGMCIVITLWLDLQWPGGLQGIVISLVIWQSQFFYDVEYQARQSLLGSACGGLIGLICLHFLIFNIINLLIIVFIVGWIFAYITFVSPRFTAFGIISNFAFALSMIQSSGPTTLLYPSLQLMSGLFLSLIVNLTLAYFLLDLNPMRRLTQHKQQIKTKLYKIIEDILQTKSEIDVKYNRDQLENTKLIFEDMLNITQTSIKANQIDTLALRKIYFMLYTLLHDYDINRVNQLLSKLDMNLLDIYKDLEQIAQIGFNDPSSQTQRELIREHLIHQLNEFIQAINVNPYKTTLRRIEISYIVDYLERLLQFGRLLSAL